MEDSRFLSVLDEARACDDAQRRVAMLDEACSRWKAHPQLLALLAEAYVACGNYSDAARCRSDLRAIPASLWPRAALEDSSKSLLLEVYAGQRPVEDAACEAIGDIDAYVEAHADARAVSLRVDWMCWRDGDYETSLWLLGVLLDAPAFPGGSGALQAASDSAPQWLKHARWCKTDSALWVRLFELNPDLLLERPDVPEAAARYAHDGEPSEERLQRYLAQSKAASSASYLDAALPGSARFAGTHATHASAATIGRPSRTATYEPLPPSPEDANYVYRTTTSNRERI